MTAAPLIGHCASPDLHVMTFNIRRRMQHVDRRNADLWSRRRPAIRRLLDTEQPAILGVQEALPDQAEFVAMSLGRTYKRIGRGRSAERRGEGCPVFYDTERLRVREWTQFALSDTPEVAGSRSWGNFVPRIVVSVAFTDRATGRDFHFFNTHFDHLSQRSRIRSAQMLDRLVDDAATPSIVTGDFNTSVGTEPHTELLKGGTLRDAWQAAGHRLTEQWGTFPNYRAPKLDRKRIDWILVGRGVEVLSAGINPARDAGVAASDHLPVQAVIRLDP